MQTRWLSQPRERPRKVSDCYLQVMLCCSAGWAAVLSQLQTCVTTNRACHQLVWFPHPPGADPRDFSLRNCFSELQRDWSAITEFLSVSIFLCILKYSEPIITRNNDIMAKFFLWLADMAFFSYQHCWQECSRGSVLGLNYSADPFLAYVHSASSAEGSGNQSSHVLGGWWHEIRGYSFEQYTLCKMVLCENHICSH